MPHPMLEEVFKLSGVPTYTFVKPVEYDRLLVSLRTPGRGVIIEGPSGIGKTTAVSKALSELNLESNTRKLSARKKADRDQIALLAKQENLGTVIIDDFHRLHPAVQQDIGDLLKTLADEERTDSKLILVGINKVGEALVAGARDLTNRIDVIKFEVNPDDRVEEVLRLGERALNVQLNVRSSIVDDATGSFYIAQMLAHETCLTGRVVEAQESLLNVEVSFEVVRSRVVDRLSAAFRDVAIEFASGPKLRRGGRAPYLHILKWLAEAEEWSVNLDRQMAINPDQRGSVGQVVEKGYLARFLESSQRFADVLHYQPSTHILTVEDPQFVFYLRNLAWNKFGEVVGYVNLHFESSYDFALSFSGADREIAQRIFEILTEHEYNVFYDKNEQHRILAENVEDYLAPIYKSEARYVVVLLGPDYPKRIWTKFESQQFKERFGSGAVIPVWFSSVPPGLFDETTRIGGYTLDLQKNNEPQLQEFAALLIKKYEEKSVQIR